MLQLVQGQRKMGEGREGGTWEEEGKRGWGDTEECGWEKSVQRTTPYIRFHPLDMTRVYESFGII